MKPLSFRGGVAGALSLVLLQETLKRISPAAPRLDLLRKEAAACVLKKAGWKDPSEKQLNLISLAGDVMLNTLYFSFAGVKAETPLLTGTLLGLGMTAGAHTLPGLLGLNTTNVNNGSIQRSLMVAGMFIAGGALAAKLANILQKR